MDTDRSNQRSAAPAGRAGILSRWARAGIVGGLGLCLLSARAAAAEPLTVGIRASLLAPPGAESHGRIYTILSIQQISAFQKIAPPVGVDALLRQVRQSLATQGFQAARGRQQPEIVLIVQYGRDWLDNPYLDEPGTVSGISSATAVNGVAQSAEKLPSQTLAGVPLQLMNHIGVGAEARTQKAGYEKLYLRIVAWQYQPDPNARANQVWSTTMTVDDPDHSDLNALATGMLAAGAPYFDRDINEPELEVSRPVPDGRVKLGAPEVIGVPAPQPGRKSPTEVAVSPDPGGSDKSFALAAGEAITSLREFARQADTEIIYSSAELSGIRTHAISGELSPRAALDRLLDGTGLIAIPDEKSGAFVIRRASGR